MLDDSNQRFVLLDRDGVINEAVRDGYVSDATMLRLIPGSAEAIAALNRRGYKVIVISNQQCVGKGILSLEELDRITMTLRERILAESGGVIADFFYCPHLASDECDCRKPKPGLIRTAQERHGFDLRRTFLVGDSYQDIETARRAGCPAIFVLSGLDAQRYRTGEPLPVPSTPVVADLREAIQMIFET